MISKLVDFSALSALLRIIAPAGGGSPRVAKVPQETGMKTHV